MKDRKQHEIPQPQGPGHMRKGQKYGENQGYSFGSLAIGESMTGPHKIACAARAWGRRNGATFTSRKINTNKTRVWRTA